MPEPMHGWRMVMPLLLCSSACGGEMEAVVAAPPSDAGRWSRLLPDGLGKAYVQAYCSGCHDLRLVLLQRKDQRAWTATVLQMLERLGTGSDEQADVLIAYLAQHFGPQNVLRELPLPMQSADTAALARLPGFTLDAANRFVALRPRQGFGSTAELERCLRQAGVDPALVLPFVTAEKKSAP